MPDLDDYSNIDVLHDIIEMKRIFVQKMGSKTLLKTKKLSGVSEKKCRGDELAYDHIIPSPVQNNVLKKYTGH